MQLTALEEFIDFYVNNLRQLCYNRLINLGQGHTIDFCLTDCLNGGSCQNGDNICLYSHSIMLVNVYFLMV